MVTRTLAAVLCLTLLAAVSVTGAKHTLPVSNQGGPDADAIAVALDRVLAAHGIAAVSPELLKSYRLSACMELNKSSLPQAAAKAKIDCIREETGVLQPSRAYVSVVVAGSRITQIIDISRTLGWQISSAADNSSWLPANRSVSALQPYRYDALLEDTRHSLIALLAFLKASSSRRNRELNVGYLGDELRITWTDGGSVNEFLFDKATFLCRKQIRTVGGSSIVLKYENYKNVSEVMLPHTIIVAKADNTLVATRHVLAWDLAAKFGDEFDPQAVR